MLLICINNNIICSLLYRMPYRFIPSGFAISNKYFEDHVNHNLLSKVFNRTDLSEH